MVSVRPRRLRFTHCTRDLMSRGGCGWAPTSASASWMHSSGRSSAPAPSGGPPEPSQGRRIWSCTVGPAARARPWRALPRASPSPRPALARAQRPRSRASSSSTRPRRSGCSGGSRRRSGRPSARPCSRRRSCSGPGTGCQTSPARPRGRPWAPRGRVSAPLPGGRRLRRCRPSSSRTTSLLLMRPSKAHRHPGHRRARVRMC
mmetsp:Transcript_35175/g.100469  ORF Transcript_35175/g.100469 Transcript_35175/m.100469 type:complete len:203 (+) Transcript_35175:88-696(+)